MESRISAGNVISAGERTRLERGVDGVVAVWARHWLASLNVLTGLFAALPLLAPWLMASGHPRLAEIIYLAYRFVCHQKPERSFFIFGHQIAYCQRDLAIYTGVFVLGLVYALVRRSLHPLSWRGAFLLTLPMAVDGTTQLVGLRESTWQLRVVTGVFFALAIVWFIYPRLELGFAEIRAVLARREQGCTGSGISAKEEACPGS
ncbi:DUF2085 domain-containing protein [Thermomicrobium sp. CFH 73360]|uniref:DUF2085 domain-containing protein n=1 Tax=Thermomicrobium sp. CFH 73360 TaxID=2951987 RepID=UPI0020769A7A|nr:DUF2085 domain-containing protein [Thermomicrobium sp. CFH 73360]MCM8745639.1 DUF2085 domain-containing protein [Thermomicrobium sp. CFH 73360]